MRLQGLDLNLFIALNSLIETKSVTLAAKKLYLSQSAMSCALNRLREVLGDDILVVSGKKMVPTPYAESIYPAVKEILNNATNIVKGGKEFDPNQSNRTIKISASDFVISSFLALRINEITNTAPNLSFEVRVFYGESEIDDLLRGDIDLLFFPREYPDIQNCFRTKVFTENYVVVACSKSLISKNKLTREQFEQCEHVIMRPNGKKKSVDEQFFSLQGFERKSAIRIATYGMMHQFIIGTDRIATIPFSLAKQITQIHPVQIVETNFAMPKIEETILWHESRNKDEAILWFKNRLLSND